MQEKDPSHKDNFTDKIIESKEMGGLLTLQLDTSLQLFSLRDPIAREHYTDIKWDISSAGACR